MIQTGAIHRGSEQATDKNAIRPFQVNVPGAEPTELRRSINNTTWRARAAKQWLIALCLGPTTLHASLAIVTRAAVIGIAVALHALSASAQSAKDVKGSTPLVAIQN